MQFEIKNVSVLYPQTGAVLNNINLNIQKGDFIGIVGFKNRADFLEKFGKKGVKFIVIGRVQTGSYEKDGNRVFTTDVIAEQIEFAESKKTSDAGLSEEYAEVPEGFEGLPFK